MASRTEPASGSYFNGFRLGSWALHAASWLTTYWLCEWVAEPKTQEAYAITIAFSLALEFLVLHKMKMLLFDGKKGNDALGWAGFGIDTIINMGGLLPRMARLASWQPLVLFAGAFGLDIAAGKGNAVAAIVLALIVGAILSYAPIRLSQQADT